MKLFNINLPWLQWQHRFCLHKFRHSVFSCYLSNEYTTAACAKLEVLNLFVPRNNSFCECRSSKYLNLEYWKVKTSTTTCLHSLRAHFTLNDWCTGASTYWKNTNGLLKTHNTLSLSLRLVPISYAISLRIWK